jgi:Competence protein
MRFALLEGRRVEAKPKQRATCPGCQSEVVAKCGKHNAWHWSHKARAHCDPWWETEGEWHRNWKNRFPVDWQEIICDDSASGERHIAEVKTPSGLVMNFSTLLLMAPL